MSSPTIAPMYEEHVQTRAGMLGTVVAGAASGLPVPHSLTLTGPDDGRGQATLWLDNGDTQGVDDWARMLIEAGAQQVTVPAFDARRYPATAGPGSYRIYRAELDLDGWRVAIGCQVIP